MWRTRIRRSSRSSAPTAGWCGPSAAKAADPASSTWRSSGCTAAISWCTIPTRPAPRSSTPAVPSFAAGTPTAATGSRSLWTAKAWSTSPVWGCRIQGPGTAGFPWTARCGIRSISPRVRQRTTGSSAPRIPR